ncbi:MAG: lipoate--protein ligase family protein [Deltaproteobacteria bacterium]|nr:lipoate--protein ligase family protein [Deltaproteobacteria bacterium]
MEKWRLIPPQPYSGEWNMALDVAIWKGVCREEQPPTLRCYLWERPTISLGYGQNPLEDLCWEECRRRDVPVVWRPTGGKAIYHDWEFTYSVAAPKGSPYFPDSIEGSYRVISRCLIEALNPLGIHAEFSGAEMKEEGAACFLTATPQEVVVAHRKLIGSAQRRNGQGFLQQGSLLMSSNVEPLIPLFGLDESDKEHWEQRVTSLSGELETIPSLESIFLRIRQGFEKMLGIGFCEAEPSAEEEKMAQEIQESFRIQEENGFQKVVF